MKKILVYGMSNSYGGIQSFFLNLIHFSNKEKVLFDFVLSSKTPVLYKDDIYKNGGKIYGISPWGNNPLEHRHSLKKIFKENDYDYIWINTTSASNISIYKIAEKYSNAEIIIHAHGSSFETRNKGLKEKLLKKSHEFNLPKLSSFADYKFAVSDEAAEWLFEKTSMEDKSIEIINNGIESKKYQYRPNIRNLVREQLKLKDAFTILHIGRIEKVKNHIFTIDVFNQIQLIKPNAMLLIVGTGSLEEEIKNKVKKYSLESKVKFLGYQNDIENYLQAADCLILPSFSEGLPLTVVEAQAAGLKSVVSKEAVPETADVTNLVSYKSLNESPSVWAKEIVSYASDYNRKDEFKTMRNSGFDVIDTVKSIEKILKL